MNRALLIVPVLALAAACGSPSPTPTAAPPASAAQPSPAAVPVEEFCAAVFRDGVAATDAVTSFLAHLDGVGLTVAQFAGPRDRLAADAAAAPVDLRKHVDAQVAVLTDIIDVLTTGRNRTIQTGDLRDAQITLMQECAALTA